MFPQAAKAGSERGNSVENREKSKKPVVKLGTKSSHAAYFMPMLESFAARDDLNEVIKNRVSKACDLLDAGVPLFPNDFRKEHAVSWVLEKFGSREEDALEKHGVSERELLEEARRVASGYVADHTPGKKRRSLPPLVWTAVGAAPFCAAWLLTLLL